MFHPKSVKKHLDESHIAIKQHVEIRVRELEGSLRSRRALYLDTCFWLKLRDASNQGRAIRAFALLEALRDQVNAGIVFCPISDSIFTELMKQTDPASRSATTALIEELSLGVTLVSEQERVEKEVSRFIRTSARLPQSPNGLKGVWCKLAFILGVVHPHETPFDPASELAIQKAFFDHMWTQPLSKVVEAVAGRDLPGSDWTELVSLLNQGNAEHSDDLRSFRQVYKAEVRGMVDLIGDIAVNSFFELAAEMGAPPGHPTVEMRKETENFWKNVIADKLEKGTVNTRLPSLHIPASLHASLRWNKQQKLDSHDIFDFQHATAALAYCDAFFTERPLSNMIKQNHLRLDREFDCVVTSDIEEALAYVSRTAPVDRKSADADP